MTDLFIKAGRAEIFDLIDKVKKQFSKLQIKRKLKKLPKKIVEKAENALSDLGLSGMNDPEQIYAMAIGIKDGKYSHRVKLKIKAMVIDKILKESNIGE